MLEQFVAVMPGTLAPALLVMSLSVMLTVGEGRDKPISSHWRLIGLIVGLIAAIVFAGLRASAVINQRTFVNYPVLWCAIIADILTIVVVVFARRITTNWQQHKVFMHIANAVAAIDIALTLFCARLPDEPYDVRGAGLVHQPELHDDYGAGAGVPESRRGLHRGRFPYENP